MLFAVPIAIAVGSAASVLLLVGTATTFAGHAAAAAEGEFLVVAVDLLERS